MQVHLDHVDFNVDGETDEEISILKEFAKKFELEETDTGFIVGLSLSIDKNEIVAATSNDIDINVEGDDLIECLDNVVDAIEDILVPVMVEQNLDTFNDIVNTNTTNGAA